MKTAKFVKICLLVFTFSLVIGVITKFVIKPNWAKKYTVEWSDEIGTLYSDVPYGDNEANKFDLYLPKDNSKKDYGLVVYLHAGGFTSGDKKDDEGMLAWLCSKGYVAAGINYTLRTDTNNASVLSQSNEIKEAIPQVIEEAKKHGYNINGLAMSGGSAGGTLAMIYAYRDVSTAPVPVKLMFQLVGPPSFFVEDWDTYGLGKDTAESKEAAAGLFGVMSGVELTPDMIESKEYEELLKPISAFSWVNKDSVPSIIAYGKYDKICPFKSVRHLVAALENNHVDYQYFEAPNSGHGLQNDDRIYKEFMETVEQYLEKYLPVSNS